MVSLILFISNAILISILFEIFFQNIFGLVFLPCHIIYFPRFSRCGCFIIEIYQNDFIMNGIENCRRLPYGLCVYYEFRIELLQ